MIPINKNELYLTVSDYIKNMYQSYKYPTRSTLSLCSSSNYLLGIMKWINTNELEWTLYEEIKNTEQEYRYTPNSQWSV